MDLRDIIRDACNRMEIPIHGVASADRWNTPLFEPWIPSGFFPANIFPETRSVIVIGLPVHLPVLETSPSIWYQELYKTVNTLLDQYTYRIASILNERGFPSVFVPRDGYGGIEALQRNPVAFFSHRHAAFLAGLGTFGVNNMLLTRAYGPRVRFGSVLTAADIEPDPLLTEDLCIRCNRCVSLCPANALEEGSYPQTLTDKKACTSNSAELNKHYTSPCGICIKVCPVGKDRVLFNHENAGIYEETSHDPSLQNAWDHVRRYGTR